MTMPRMMSSDWRRPVWGGVVASGMAMLSLGGIVTQVADGASCNPETAQRRSRGARRRTRCLERFEGYQDTGPSLRYGASRLRQLRMTIKRPPFRGPFVRYA